MKFLKPLVVFVIIVNCQILFAQGSTFNLNRVLTFDVENTDVNKIPFKIKPGTSSMNIKIVSKIYKGDLTIEIYDSFDAKKGEFSIQSVIPDNKRAVVMAADKNESSTSNGQPISEFVSGEIEKHVSFPGVGDWYIKIISKKVIGQINVNMQFNLDN